MTQTILVVEDEPTLQETLKYNLDLSGTIFQLTRADLNPRVEQ